VSESSVLSPAQVGDGAKSSGFTTTNKGRTKMSKYEIETISKTVTTIHHEAITDVHFPTEQNQVKVAIFDKEYYLNWASIQSVWEDGDYIPEPYIKVSYVSILKNGKAGEAYDKREFSITDIGKWIKGEEDLFKSMFEQHNETIQNILQAKVGA
jgi:hypothetical protein